MYPKKDEKVINGHSTSAGGMDRPPMTQQLIEGVNINGTETGKILIDDFDTTFTMGVLYFDTKEQIEVLPIREYNDRIEISDGRSCTIEYAMKYWEALK
jgi:hypothetical protein